MQRQTKSTSVTSDYSKERLAGLEAVAERLSVSIWTIRKWCQLGKVSSVKLGKRRLIAESEIERIISQGLK